MKKICSLILAILLIFSLCGCIRKESDKNLKEIIDNTGYDSIIDEASASIISSMDLPGNVENLRKNGNYKLVLVASDGFNNKTEYNICVVDFENAKMALFEYGDYFPLKTLAEEYINTSSRKTQNQNFNVVYTYIKEYGFSFAKNQKYAESFIRRITGKNGYIPISEARNIINGALPSAVPNYNSYDFVEADFEQDCAVPTSYEGTITTNNRQTLVTLDKNFNQVQSSTSDNKTILAEEEYVYDEYRFVEEDELPENVYYENETLYRVRKSASDASSQIGAFSVFENAAKLANSHKSEGYEVYDTNGNLIYTP